MDESVADLWQSLDKARLVRRITQHIAQPREHVIQAVVEIDVDMACPETLAQLVARDDFTGFREELAQYLERLFL